MYGREAVTSISNMWWSLPVNKYNCWSCCVHDNSEKMVDDSVCTSLSAAIIIIIFEIKVKAIEEN